MSGPGERSRYVLTRNPLTHAVGKVLPAHRGTVHAMSIRRRASPGLDVASVTYDYDGALACGRTTTWSRRTSASPDHQPADGQGGCGRQPSADGGSTDRLPGYVCTRGRRVLASDPS